MNKILLDKSLFNNFTHGYFLVRKYFKGKFVREIHASFFDTQLNETSHAYIYVCENNILIYTKRLKIRPSVLFELEKQDEIVSVPVQGNDLSKILNNPFFAEKSMSIETSSPVKLMVINKRFLVLCNMRADVNYTDLTFYVKTIFLNKKNYAESVDNLRDVIKQIVNQEKVSWDKPLPGIGKNLALLNLAIVVIGLISVCIFSFILPFIDIVVSVFWWLMIAVSLITRLVIINGKKTEDQGDN